jgi:hypothetical protein
MKTRSSLLPVISGKSVPEIQKKSLPSSTILVVSGFETAARQWRQLEVAFVAFEVAGENGAFALADGVASIPFDLTPRPQAAA